MSPPEGKAESGGENYHSLLGTTTRAVKSNEEPESGLRGQESGARGSGCGTRESLAASSVYAALAWPAASERVVDREHRTTVTLATDDVHLDLGGDVRQAVKESETWHGH